MSAHRNPLVSLMVWCIRGYQTFVSPALPRSCKYYPSCSQYAVDALREYGLLRGTVLAGWRLLRCNPLSMGGIDPVERQTLFAPRNQAGRGAEGGRRQAPPVSRDVAAVPLTAVSQHEATPVSHQAARTP